MPITRPFRSDEYLEDFEELHSPELLYTFPEEEMEEEIASLSVERVSMETILKANPKEEGVVLPFRNKFSALVNRLVKPKGKLAGSRKL